MHIAINGRLLLKAAELTAQASGPHTGSFNISMFPAFSLGLWRSRAAVSHYKM